MSTTDSLIPLLKKLRLSCERLLIHFLKPFSRQSHFGALQTRYLPSEP